MWCSASPSALLGTVRCLWSYTFMADNTDTIRSLRRQEIWLAQKLLCGGGTTVVTLTPDLKVELCTALKNHLGSDAQFRVISVSNPVPQDLHQEPVPLRTLQLENPRILFLSNMIESKGYAILVEALGLLSRRYAVDLELTLAGSFNVSAKTSESPGRRRAALERMILDEGLRDSIRVLGAVEHAEVPSLLDSHDILALPTTYRNEGLPMVAIEAMSRGLLLLATNHRGLSGLLQGGRTGSIIGAATAEAITESLRSIVSDPSSAARRAAEGRQYVLERFSVEQTLDPIIRLISA